MQPRDTFLLVLGLVPAGAFTLDRLVAPRDYSVRDTGIALPLAILTVLSAVILVVQYPEQPDQRLPHWVLIGYVGIGLLVCLGELLFI